MAIFNTPLEIINHQIEYFSRPGAVLARGEKYGACFYKDGYGNKCAVGCLVPDDLYGGIEPYEGESVSGDLFNSLEGWGIIASDPNEDILYLLEKTQLMHDNEANNAQHLVELLKEFKEEFYGSEAE